MQMCVPKVRVARSYSGTKGVCDIVLLAAIAKGMEIFLGFIFPVLWCPYKHYGRKQEGTAIQLCIWRPYVFIGRVKRLCPSYFISFEASGVVLIIELVFILLMHLP